MSTAPSRARTLAAAVAALALACTRPPAPAPTASAERIVVMAPGAAEMLVALGQGDAIVAVGDFVLWPPALLSRPRVGAYDRPNEERLLELATTLYVTTRSQAGAATHTRLRSLGIDVLELDTSTMPGVLASFHTLGARLDRAARAADLVAAIERRLASVAARAAGLPRRRVLCVVGRDPLYVAGAGSHLDELIRIAGASNVAHDTRAPYQLLSLEAALARRPEVILDTSDNRPGALRGRAAGDWGTWPFLPAVAADRVYWLDPTQLAIPGPRLPEMAELVARLVHPERFGEPRPADFTPLRAPRQASDGT